MSPFISISTSILNILTCNDMILTDSNRYDVIKSTQEYWKKSVFYL